MTIRIAILADIHGNVPALDAVFADIERQAPDHVLVGGDLVGRGPEGSAVVAEIRRRGWPTIRGNHEDYLLSFRKREVPDDWWQRDEWAAARWMSAELADEDVEFIDSLPYTLTTPVAPGLQLAHGTPDSANEGLGPWTGDDALEDQLERIDEDVLVVAHTHRPMLRELGDGTVINVGSVGLPFNGDQRAQYAILAWNGQAWRVEFRQVDYDVEEILAIYRSSGFLEAGGVTAQLLEYEIRHARPFLVPFIDWARALDHDPVPERMAEFLDLYDPGEPFGAFWRKIQHGRGR